MKLRYALAATSIVACCGLLISCDSRGAAFSDLLSQTESGSGDQSVGDVSRPGGADSSSGQPLPFAGAVSARVRNESSSHVDVTMRFMREDSIVHLAFVSVPAATITSVTSPDAADLVKLSGEDENGQALRQATFRYGVDFDEGKPAEYVVVDRNASGGEGEGDPDGPLSLTLVEPADDVTVTVGETLLTQWVDGGGGPGATVRTYLRPAGSVDESTWRPIGPPVGASLDGINDVAAVLVQGVRAGQHELVAELRDGDAQVLAVAPGRIHVLTDPLNQAPSVTIEDPKDGVEVAKGATFAVKWSDLDADDNATIEFSLERLHTTDAAGGSFIISPPIAEDPDGTTGDSAVLSVAGVLPGLYDLAATIDDGQLKGTDRRERAIRVLPAAQNDPPQLILLEPSADKALRAGDTITVRWTDSDDNDNAIISFLIDGDWGRVDLRGGERLLVSGIEEDDKSDTITLDVPGELAAGKYRLIGVIADGMTQVITRAPGFVLVDGAPSTIIVPNDDGGTAGNDDGDDGGDPDDGSGGNDDGSTGDDGTDDTGGDTGEGAGGDGGNGDGTGNGGDGTGDSGSGDDGGEVSDPGVVVIDRPTEMPRQRAAVSISSVSYLVAFQPETPVIPAGLLMTNEPYGGDAVIEIDPPANWHPSERDPFMQIEVPFGLVPNDAWPRSFDLVIQYYTDRGIRSVVVPRPVWIPQLVELLSADTLNYNCGGPIYEVGRDWFYGVQLTWFGGGTSEFRPAAGVAFWLSRDGRLPSSGQDDAEHRLLMLAPGSPNQMRVTRIEMETVLNGATWGSPAGSDPSRRDGSLPNADGTPPLLPGEYRVITVADYAEYGRLVTTPDLPAITICSSDPDSD